MVIADTVDFQNVTPDEDAYHDKWYGVPPAGEKPVRRWRSFIEILIVIFIEFVIWGVYRALTAPIYDGFGSLYFYLGHIIAAPTISLGPILIYWIGIRKEKLFVKTDREGVKFNSFLLGPFKMTRKFLMTAIFVGLIGGIIWRVSEFLVTDMTSVLMGGSEMFSLHLFNLLPTSGEGIGLFLLMTFVMFFIVGPVEEFEFRSFVHDQSARVFPLGIALIISSVLFGFSHIPIAIFVYKMPIVDLIVAEISWISAGFVFGALYMWSRNIFACIVMHGIGNWQLSVFFLQSKFAGEISHSQYLIESVITSIVANAFIIVIFYLVHRYYWEPQRRGKLAFGGKLVRMQEFFYRHDSGDRNLAVTSFSMAGFTAVILVILVVITAGIGTTNFSLLEEGTGAREPEGFDLQRYTVNDTEVIANAPDMAEGTSVTIPLNSTSEQIIRSVQVSVTWTDEPDIRRIRTFENQPDTFSVEIPAEGTNKTAESSNQRGREGSVNLDMTYSDEFIRSVNGTFETTVTVTMVSAGDYEPAIGPGVFYFADSGNECSIEIIVDYITEASGSSGGSEGEEYVVS